ncbi:MAG TPA: TerC family protein [Burkholderiales bacterium]|nr:TerC family protein [Burkholderiales bacterium]
MIESTGTPALYLAFALLVIAFLAVDFFVLRAAGSHKVSIREAAAWSLAWIAVGLAFCAWFWWHVDGELGREIANRKALEYLTGYVIEKSLAVDNVFVWLTIFGFFAVPAEYQKRVLLYGVVGAILLRAILIFLGALLLARFHWVLYLFGAFLVITGVRMALFAEHEPDLARNPLLGWMRRHLRVTEDYAGEKFTVVRNGLRYVTPLFLVLALIEVTDVVFAVDSIPAIFAVTDDPFIVFTSNIFAILGLRAMYFLLADMAQRFHLLKYGLALILVFVGIKMLAADLYAIPTPIALGVVLAILAASVVLSLRVPRRAQPTP